MIPNPILRLLYQAGQLPLPYIASNLDTTLEDAGLFVQLAMDEGQVVSTGVWTFVNNESFELFELAPGVAETLVQ